MKAKTFFKINPAGNGLVDFTQNIIWQMNLGRRVVVYDPDDRYGPFFSKAKESASLKKFDLALIAEFSPWAELKTHQDRVDFANSSIGFELDEASVVRSARTLLVDLIDLVEDRFSSSMVKLLQLLRDPKLLELEELLEGYKSQKHISALNASHANRVITLVVDAFRFSRLAEPTVSETLVEFVSKSGGGVVFISRALGSVGAGLLEMIARRVKKKSLSNVSIFAASQSVLPVATDEIKFGLNPLALAVGLTVGKIRESNESLDRWFEQICYTSYLDEGQTDLSEGSRRIYVAGVPVPHRTENQHIACLGAPGSGKSVAIFDIMEQVIDRNDSFLCYSKKGDEIRAFYNPNKHTIISPFDARSAAWLIFDEITQPSIDIPAFVEILIEEQKGDGFWYKSGRKVLSEIFLKLYNIGERTNEAICRMIFFTPLADLCEWLKGTAAASLMPDADNKAAQGILATIAAEMEIWTHLRDEPDASKRVSISKFVREAREDGRGLFLPSFGRAHAIMKGLISLFLTIGITEILSGDTSDKRKRIWVIIDETPSLRKLKKLPELMAEGRGYGAAALLGIQSFAQIDAVYEKDEAEAMLGNLKTSIILNMPEPTSAERASKRIGEMSMIVKTLSRNISANDERDQMTLGQTRQKEAAVLPGTIQSLPALNGFLVVPGFPALKLRLTPRQRKNPEGNENSIYVDKDGYPLQYAIPDHLTPDKVKAIEEKARDAKATLVSIGFMSKDDILNSMDAFGASLAKTRTAIVGRMDAISSKRNARYLDVQKSAAKLINPFTGKPDFVEDIDNDVEEDFIMDRELGEFRIA